MRKLKTKSIASHLVAALLLGTPSVRAATYIWSGGAANEYWSSSANWQGGIAPTANESGLSLVFSNGVTVKTITNDVPGLQVAILRFQGSNYVLHGKPSGNALTMLGGMFGFTITANDHNNQFASTSPLVLSNTGSITVNGTNTLKLSSVVSGPGSLVKTGPGTLLFNAPSANTFSGGLTVSDGDLSVAAVFNSFVPRVSIPGPLTIGGTNLSYSPRVQLLADSQFSTNTAVTVNGNAQLLFNGHSSPLGDLAIQAGLVDTTVSGTNAGTLTLHGDVTALTDPLGLTNSVFLGALDLGSSNRVIDVQTNTTLEIRGGIAGSSTSVKLTKAGAGRLLLAPTDGLTNSYAGPTVIADGVVELINTTLGTTDSGTTISNLAQLVISAPAVATNTESFTCYGSSDRTMFIVEDDLTLTGNITLNNTVRFSVMAGKTLNLRSALGDGSVGGLGLGGAGLVRLSGTQQNSFTGETTVTDGWVELAREYGKAIPGNLKILGGTVSWSGASQVANHPALTVNSPGTANLGSWSGAFGTLSGDGAIILSGGAGLDVAPAAGVDCTFAGTISGNGSLSKISGGSLTLSGDGSSFHGTIHFGGGTLNVPGNYSQCHVNGYSTGRVTGLGSGTLNLGAAANTAIAPGNNGPAIVPISGNLGFVGTSSTLEVDINGPAPGTGYDQLVVDGYHQLNGGKILLNLNYQATPGEQFTLIKHTGASAGLGAFPWHPEHDLTTTNGQAFQITYKGGPFSNDVVLTRVSTNAPQIGMVQLKTGFAGGLEAHLSATGSPKAVYSLWATENLTTPVTWVNKGPVQADAVGQISFIDITASLHPQRFFRLTLP